VVLPLYTPAYDPDASCIAWLRSISHRMVAFQRKHFDQFLADVRTQSGTPTLTPAEGGRQIGLLVRDDRPTQS
jgi:hypothetical protein